MKPTQAEIDRAYDDGKRTYLRDIGTHGPTFNPPPLAKTPNPYANKHFKLQLAWQRGYYQDTRKVIA
jgi:hypothetical protein